KTHNYSLYIAIVVTVRKGTKILQAPKFESDAAQQLITEAGRDQFRKMYGDEFLAGITSGGEFIAFLEIQTANRSEHEEASASISGGDLLGANTASGNIKSVLDKVKSKY